MEEINLMREIRVRLAEIRKTANDLIHQQYVNVMMLSNIQERADEISALLDYVEDDLKEV